MQIEDFNESYKRFTRRTASLSLDSDFAPMDAILGAFVEEYKEVSISDSNCPHSSQDMLNCKYGDFDHVEFGPVFAFELSRRVFIKNYSNCFEFGVRVSLSQQLLIQDFITACEGLDEVNNWHKTIVNTNGFQVCCTSTFKRIDYFYWKPS
jgi:hypothetical protein